MIHSAGPLGFPSLEHLEAPGWADESVATRDVGGFSASIELAQMLPADTHRNRAEPSEECDWFQMEVLIIDAGMDRPSHVYHSKGE